MSVTATETTPARSADLVLAPRGPQGRYVVKNRRTGSFFSLGEPEHFLLGQMDGRRSYLDVCQAFETQFGEPLSPRDVADFIKSARSQGLVATSTADVAAEAAVAKPAKRRVEANVLCTRVTLFDPDRFLTWLEPKVRFFWTPCFLVLSSIAILAAGWTLWLNWAEVSSPLSNGGRWELWALAWLVLVVATFCHEFAHGLTCKRHGGEVHEIGVMFMFLTPCFFCNVSDAWLIPERSKRLWITLAGTYCDLCMWALAVFAWRLTMQDTLLHYLAWAVLTVCGGRIFFNVNPLMKLDGYYLLSDWLEIPNLRRRSREYWTSILRWILWGSARPAKVPRGRTLIIFGMVTWTFSAVFLDIMFFRLADFLGARCGPLGIALAVWLAVKVVRRVFRGFSSGEVKTMLKTRRNRTVAWVGGALALWAVLSIIPWQDRTGGSFQVRAGDRAEIRAGVAGFLREVKFDEGEQVSAGAIVARLEVPDLTSQMAQKRAELRESQANLRRLEAGPRPEEVNEQRLRVERSKNWRELGRQDLARADASLQEDLSRLDQQIAQYRSELDFVTQTLIQSERLYERGVLAGQQLLSEKKKQQVVQSQWQQAQSEKRSRQAEGNLKYESELARREKELADAQAALSLLEAGGRPEEIDAEKARQARLQEELKYLESVEERLVVTTPVGGQVITPRMKEKIGQYLEKGALICLVEDSSGLEAVLAVPEQDVAGIKMGQTVELKARALPFQTFLAKVERIAPAAVTAEGAPQGTVSVYCHVAGNVSDLRSGMTGFGRVCRGSQSVALLLAKSTMRHVRTEFWW